MEETGGAYIKTSDVVHRLEAVGDALQCREGRDAQVAHSAGLPTLGGLVRRRERAHFGAENGGSGGGSSDGRLR